MPTRPDDTRTPDAADAGGAPALTSGRLLARNAAWNLATQCVPLAAALLAMPFLIRGLGPERFGVLTMSWVVLGYFSLFDLGLGRALTKLTAESLGRGRADEVPALVWTAMTLMTALGLAGTAVVVALSPWLAGPMLHFEGPLRAEALASFLIMGAALPLVIGTSGLRGVMEAHQRFTGINTVRTATSLFIQVAPLAVLPFTTNLAVVVGLTGLARAASWAAHVWLSARTVPGASRPAFRAELVRPLLGFGGWMTAVNVINPVMVQMDRFLIGALVSAAAVTYYSTPHELIVKSWFLSNAVLGVMFPAFAASFVADRRRTAEIFGRCLKHVGLILFPVALVGVGLSREVLTVWVGQEFALRSARVLAWLTVGVFLCGVAQVPSALLQGVGRPDLVFRLHLAELVAYAPAAWVLIGRYGIEGAAVAWAGRAVLDLVLFAWAAARVLPESSGAVRSMTLAVGAASGVLLLSALPPGGAPRFATVGFLAAASAAVAWSRVLGPDERGAVLGRLSSWRDRFGPAAARAVGVGEPVAGASGQ